MMDNIFQSDVIYRCIGEDFNEGVLSCGYMVKHGTEKSQYNFIIGYYSCFLLLRGKGVYIDAEGVRTPIQAGDLVQRFPDICHSTEIYPDGQWLEFYISFGRGVFDYLNKLNLLNTQSPVISTNIDHKILKSFSGLLMQMKKADERRLPELLLEAQEIVFSLHNNSIQNISNPYEDAMAEACRLLSSGSGKELKLEEIAHAVHMSYENFRKVFVKSIGRSPASYRTEQKMKQAKMMLLSGVSIIDTALFTGYSDTYSFTKQFTKSVGMAPGKYVKYKSV